MQVYDLRWITDSLAVGHAPLSYQELDFIREAGIDAIVNLCGEYCDLHQIEGNYGFDVFYLPVEDDRAPQMEEMEKALDWLDEALYLGKKVLVHCRMGMGRTGTFVTSYLLRRGFGLKLAKKKLKNTRTGFTSYSQWRHLKKYEKKSGKLTICEPSLEGSRPVDLEPYFSEYEGLVERVENFIDSLAPESSTLERCGLETDECCNRFLYLQFVEAAYLSHYLNRSLRQEERYGAIARAAAAYKAFCSEKTDEACEQNVSMPSLNAANDPGAAAETDSGYRCPLSVDRMCIAYGYRPIACRVFTIPSLSGADTLLQGTPAELGHLISESSLDLEGLKKDLNGLSGRLFFALSEVPLEGKSLLFPLTQVVSGKFVADYFSLLLNKC